VRNATLLCLWLLSLAIASAAAAQTDDAEGDEAAEPDAASEGEASPADDSETLAEPALEEGDLEEEEAAQSGEAEEEEAEAPAAAPEQLPWRNSFFDWNHSVTFNSFLRDAQLAYNPYYYQTFTLTPRWYVGPTSFFWASQSLGVELTDSDGDAFLRDPQLFDTFVDFRHLIPWEGFMFQLAARLALPVSKASQAAQRYLSTGLGVTVIRPIPEAFLTLAGSFTYRRWWAGSNVVQSGQPLPAFCPGPQAAGSGAPEEGGGITCDQAGGVSVGRDLLISGVTLTFAYESISLTGVFLFVNQYSYDLAPGEITVATREEPLVLEDTSRTHWRNFTYFTLALAWQALPWLSVTVGFQNAGAFAPAYNTDGSVRSIFNPDSQVYLSTTFQLDSIYTELVGSEDDGLTPEERQRRRQGLARRTSEEGASF
jgi:hypothetical protein